VEAIDFMELEQVRLAAIGILNAVLAAVAGVSLREMHFSVRGYRLLIKQPLRASYPFKEHCFLIEMRSMVRAVADGARRAE
jgi:hypothetical protein